MSLFLKRNPNAKEDYFSKIDSNDKAYWLGFLLTDGTVSKKSGIEITLLEEDGYILEKFQNDLGLSGHTRTVYANGIPYKRVTVWSVNMISDLEKYGVVPNKTKILKFPKNIKKKFIPSLLRGMFDGDGGITIGYTTRFYKHRNKSYTKPYRELSFTGTYDMCFNFQNIISNTLNLSRRSITKNNKTVFRIRWNSIYDIMKIFDFLYKDAKDHKLERKYNKFISIKNSDYGEQP